MTKKFDSASFQDALNELKNDHLILLRSRDDERDFLVVFLEEMQALLLTLATMNKMAEEDFNGTLFINNLLSDFRDECLELWEENESKVFEKVSDRLSELVN